MNKYCHVISNKKRQPFQILRFNDVIFFYLYGRRLPAQRPTAGASSAYVRYPLDLGGHIRALKMSKSLKSLSSPEIPRFGRHSATSPPPKSQIPTRHQDIDIKKILLNTNTYTKEHIILCKVIIKWTYIMCQKHLAPKSPIPKRPEPMNVSFHE